MTLRKKPFENKVGKVETDSIQHVFSFLNSVLYLSFDISHKLVSSNLSSVNDFNSDKSQLLFIL